MCTAFTMTPFFLGNIFFKKRTRSSLLCDVFLNTLARVKPIIHYAVISPLLWMPAYLLTTYGVDYVKLVHVLEINSGAPDTQRHKHLQDASWFIPFTTSKTQKTKHSLAIPIQQNNKTKTLLLPILLVGSRNWCSTTYSACKGVRQ